MNFEKPKKPEETVSLEKPVEAKETMEEKVKKLEEEEKEKSSEMEPSLEYKPGSIANLEKSEGLFDEATKEFYDSEPDFSEIKKRMNKIKEEIVTYRGDFSVILREEPQYGGGLEGNQDRIQNMKKAILPLEAEIKEAASIIDSNKFFEIYRKQIIAANKIIEALKKI